MTARVRLDEAWTKRECERKKREKSKRKIEPNVKVLTHNDELIVHHGHSKHKNRRAKACTCTAKTLADRKQPNNRIKSTHRWKTNSEKKEKEEEEWIASTFPCTEWQWCEQKGNRREGDQDRGRDEVMGEQVNGTVTFIWMYQKNTERYNIWLLRGC